MLIYKILLPSEWEDFRRDGQFDGSPFDRSSGFVHCSSRSQLGATARRVFPDEAVLVVVALNPNRLAASLRWEAAADGVLFPHVYAPLPSGAVMAVHHVAGADLVDEQVPRDGAGDLDTAVDEVAAALDLRVEGPLAGGEHGATAVRSAGGAPLVLKVFDGSFGGRLSRSVSMVGVLHDRGVPVPWPYETGVVVGAAFTLQARVPGNVPVVLKAEHAAEMIRHWEAHLDASVDGTDWPPLVAHALRNGEESLWADHGPIRAVGGSAGELLDEIIELSTTVDAAVMRSGDVVHGDWHHQNVLVLENELTAIIDWEASRPGDARFDLCYLSFWADVFEGTEVTPDAAGLIRAHLQARVEPSAQAVLFALVALHQLWYCSAHRPERLAEMVERVERVAAPRWRR